MAFQIVNKEQLSENVFMIDVEAPLVARSHKEGQFVIVSTDQDAGERIPLTIAGANPEKGTIRLIFQCVGKATAQMALFEKGDALGYIAGPLGQPTHIEKFGTVVCIGGGIGNAPLLPIARVKPLPFNVTGFSSGAVAAAEAGSRLFHSFSEI